MAVNGMVERLFKEEEVRIVDLWGKKRCRPTRGMACTLVERGLPFFLGTFRVVASGLSNVRYLN